MSRTEVTTVKSPEQVRRDLGTDGRNDMALLDTITPKNRSEFPKHAGEMISPDGPDTIGVDHASENPQPDRPVDLKKTMLDAAGGPWGIVASVVPTVVFATVVAFVSLPVSIGIAIAVALVIAAVQLWRGKTIGAAMGGVFGVAVAGGVSALTGSANDFFLIGIWASLAIGVVTLVSVLMRRPLTGVVWNAVHGGTHAWREDRPTLCAHYTATIALAVMGVARFAVRQWFYVADSTAGLAVADTVTGFPLTALAAVVIIWAFRRSTKRLVKKPADAPAAAWD